VPYTVMKSVACTKTVMATKLVPKTVTCTVTRHVPRAVTERVPACISVTSCCQKQEAVEPSCKG